MHAVMLLVMSLAAQAPVDATPASVPPQAPAPTCEMLVGSTIPCHEEIWKAFPTTELGDIESFEELLEGLLEGDVHYARSADPPGTGTDADDASASAAWDACLKRSPLAKAAGCADLSCVDALEDRCMLQIVEAYSRLAVETGSRPVRLGAIVLAFSVFMDEPPEPELQPAVTRALHACALSLLAGERDPPTHAAILKMMEFAELGQPEITDLVAPLMSDANEIVRAFAIERFYAATHCPSMESWPRDRMPSTEQVDVARAWWVSSRARPAAP